MRPFSFNILFLTMLFVCCFSASELMAQSTIVDSIETETKIVVDTTYNESYNSSGNENEAYRETKGNFKDVDFKTLSTVKERVDLSDSINKMKQQDEYWYHNYKEKVDNKKEEKKTNKNEEVKIEKTGNYDFIIWLLVIIALFAIIFFYLQSNGINLFAKRKLELVQTETDEEISDNIFETDFDKMIAKYATEGNYRLATRLMFLRLLKTLSERNIVKYSPDKTNFDYLFALSNTKEYQRFAELVRVYEYVWYGEFVISKKQFDYAKNQFDYLHNALKY